ncbi:MAG: hypothetical protein ACK4VM_16920 [Bosea sp. (in: a-proteobacteria)]
MLALAAVLTPAQIARANIDLPALKEAAADEPAAAGSGASGAMAPLTRFMIATGGVELALSGFGNSRAGEPGDGQEPLGHPRRLRFASAGYAPYLPGLSASETKPRNLAPLSSDGAPVAIFGSVAIPVAGPVHAGRWRQVLSEQAHIALADTCHGAQDCGGALMQKARGVVKEARALEREAIRLASASSAPKLVRA